MQDFRKLVVWQRAQALAARVHRLTTSPKGGAHGAWRNQLQRSVQSIAANVAEGAVRSTPRQFGHFLTIALGSTSETESHLDFAWRIGALSSDDVMPLLDEAAQIRRMLTALRKRVLETQRKTEH
ncbi:four helix bundle protein [Gemmatimonas phototrophica]|uniref:Four helix bundle protein n=1 Tax=Gemmatimonas phototrophica TaxID=1379270 RepID=A0A143BHW9_9BACT|nr:hypothetical protein GEMMAAP_06895 [Gemmatimonas phototrophica]